MVRIAVLSLLVVVATPGIATAQGPPQPASITTRAVQLIAGIESSAADRGSTHFASLLRSRSAPKYIAYGEVVGSTDLGRIDFSRARWIQLRHGPEAEVRVTEVRPSEAALATTLRVVPSEPGREGRTDIMVLVESTLMTHQEFVALRNRTPDYDANVAEVRIWSGPALARAAGASPVATLIHVIRK